MNIVPMQDRVLVKIEKTKERTDGGLYIPDVAKKQSDVGVVIAVGPGRLDASNQPIPVCVQPGDKIAFGRYAGNPLSFDGEEFTILREDDVMAVLKE